MAFATTAATTADILRRSHLNNNHSLLLSAALTKKRASTTGCDEPDSKIFRSRRSFHFKDRFEDQTPQRNMDMVKQELDSPSPEQVSPCGVPIPAPVNRTNAPVHIDVGGVAFTTTLDTLTRFGDSLIAKLFNGSVPVVLDSLKQHYFIDRDGDAFRHILTFLRTGHVHIADRTELLALLEEAIYFDLQQLEQIVRNHLELNFIAVCCCGNNVSISGEEELCNRLFPDQKHDSWDQTPVVESRFKVFSHLAAKGFTISSSISLANGTIEYIWSSSYTTFD